MTEPSPVIEPLTKVTLTLRTETTSTPMPKVNDSPIDFEFVFGIGTEGLTGFERAILGKNSGDSLNLSIDNSAAHAYFEHLMTPLMQTVQTRPPFELFLKVKSVSPATDRELVRALSQKVDSSGCSCGGGCGCS